MIFVTLGTHEQPFSRALEVVRNLARHEELVVQHGSTPPRPDLFAAEWVDYLECDALLSTVRRSSVVICHAGVGSIVTALHNHRNPVVLPRLTRLGEHVDDHQLELADRFAKRGLILVYHPGDCIEELVSRSKTLTPVAPQTSDASLSEAVAAAVRGDSRGGRLSAHRTSRSIGIRRGARSERIRWATARRGSRSRL